jgi:hypothetical protein
MMKNPNYMRIVSVFLLVNLIALGEVGVTSQEQFERLRRSGSPNDLSYNFERAYLEARASDHCPSESKAFFNVHISREGDVTSVRGRLVTLSADSKSIEIKWADSLLKQMHFRPLLYGNQPSSVDMALTLVCDPS